MIRINSFARLACVALLAGGGCSCDGGGEGDLDAVSFEPAALDFGVVVAGTTCERSVNVINGGSARVEFKGNVFTEGAERFAVVSAPADLLSGQQRELAVTYAPVDNGVEEHGTLGVRYAVDGQEATKELSVLGFAASQPSPLTQFRCPVAGAEAEVCTTITVPDVQRGQIGTAMVAVHNIGTDTLHITGARMESESGNWSVSQVYFGTGPGEAPVALPVNDGDPELAVLNAVGGDCGETEMTHEVRSLKIELLFSAAEVGPDSATLVLTTDDPFQPERRLELVGIGKGQRGVVTPAALAFGDVAGVLEITIANLGNNSFPINSTWIESDNNVTKDEGEEGCRPGDRDAEDGVFSCSSSGGSGFVLEATDAAAGGRDEQVIKVFYFPSENLADRTTLILKSQSLSVGSPGTPGLFRVPLGGLGAGQFAVAPSAGGDSLAIEYTVDDALQATGSAGLTLTNAGSGATSVSGLAVYQNGKPLNEGNSLASLFSVHVDGELAVFPVFVDANSTRDVSVVFERNNPGPGATWSAQIALHHDGVGPEPTLTDVSVAPAE
jgi:hypothetical protein